MKINEREGAQMTTKQERGFAGRKVEPQVIYNVLAIMSDGRAITSVANSEGEAADCMVRWMNDKVLTGGKQLHRFFISTERDGIGEYTGTEIFEFARKWKNEKKENI